MAVRKTTAPYVTTPRKPKLTIPKQIGAAADKALAIRDARIALDHLVEELKRDEATLAEHLLSELRLAGMESVRGARATFTSTPKEVPQVVDWERLYRHIKRANAFELLQRRVGVGAVRERWAQGKTVPGVSQETVPGYSLTKVGR